MVRRAVLTARLRPSWQGVAIFIGLALLAGLLGIVAYSLVEAGGGGAAAVATVTILIGLVSTLAAVASVVVSYLAWRHPHA